MNVICGIEDPTPIAFEDVYERGDRWEKIKSCKSCPEERRKKCCGDCPLLTPDGWCSWQSKRAGSQKPFNCIVNPTPDQAKSDCALVFKCVRGKNIGKLRYSKEGSLVFR